MQQSRFFEDLVVIIAMPFFLLAMAVLGVIYTLYVFKEFFKDLIIPSLKEKWQGRTAKD